MNKLIEEVATALGGKPAKNTWEEDCDMAEDVIFLVVEKAAKVVESSLYGPEVKDVLDIAAAIRALAETGEDDEQAG